MLKTFYIYRRANKKHGIYNRAGIQAIKNKVGEPQIKF
nr:MAG TPA: hypothetical protein [Caudoviricetes sp.]